MGQLDRYESIVGGTVLSRIRRLAAVVEGKRVLMVNSTRRGGGVAEILHSLVPLLNEVGVPTDWKVIEGDPAFYNITKSLHNGLQGNKVLLTHSMREAYKRTSLVNLERVDTEDYDIVIIHDPQPAALIEKRRPGQKWIWRCHIDAATPDRGVWQFLKPWVQEHDGSIFSMPAFSRELPHPQYIIYPSIDPLSPKNRAMDPGEVRDRVARLGVPTDLPLILQVSRFDRFKDPLGVIEAFKQVRSRIPCRLVLAGGSADDDPEGAEVLQEVQEAAAHDDEIFVLVLPPDSHEDINALQRAATMVLQKSVREGFGLTVSEAMLKETPVIGGAVGGITVQIRSGLNGFLVHSVAGAAHRIRYLLHRPRFAARMGQQARDITVAQFLLTRHLQNYLSLFIAAKEPEVRTHPLFQQLIPA